MSGVNLKVLNTKAVMKSFGKFGDASGKEIAQALNRMALTATNLTKQNFRDKMKHPAKSTGQLVAGIMPKFETNFKAVPLEAEVRGLAPHTIFNELGTGKRGVSSAKDRVKGYTHGGSPGMKAKNAFWDARVAIEKQFEKSIVKAIDKENPTR